jgi:hypothetical protein
MGLGVLSESGDSNVLNFIKKVLHKGGLNNQKDKVSYFDLCLALGGCGREKTIKMTEIQGNSRKFKEIEGN